MSKGGNDKHQRDDIFEFDAPQWYDFNREKYQRKRNYIEQYIKNPVINQFQIYDIITTDDESDFSPTEEDWFNHKHPKHDPSSPLTPYGPLITPIANRQIYKSLMSPETAIKNSSSLPKYSPLFSKSGEKMTMTTGITEGGARSPSLLSLYDSVDSPKTSYSSFSRVLGSPPQRIALGKQSSMTRTNSLIKKESLSSSACDSPLEKRKKIEREQVQGQSQVQGKGQVRWVKEGNSPFSRGQSFALKRTDKSEDGNSPSPPELTFPIDDDVDENVQLEEMHKEESKSFHPNIGRRRLGAACRVAIPPSHQPPPPSSLSLSSLTTIATATATAIITNQFQGESATAIHTQDNNHFYHFSRNTNNATFASTNSAISLNAKRIVHTNSTIEGAINKRFKVDDSSFCPHPRSKQTSPKEKRIVNNSNSNLNMNSSCLNSISNEIESNEIEIENNEIESNKSNDNSMKNANSSSLNAPTSSRINKPSSSNPHSHSISSFTMPPSSSFTISNSSSSSSFNNSIDNIKKLLSQHNQRIRPNKRSLV